MNIFNFVTSLFGKNKPEIELDSYAQAKLALCEALFEKLKGSIEVYAEDTQDISKDKMSNYSLEHVLGLTQYKIDGVLDTEKTLKKTARGSEHYGPELNAQVKRDFEQYQNPCIQYFKENFVPWMVTYGDKNAPGWLENHMVISESELAKKDYAPLAIDEERRVTLEGQKERIQNLVCCYRSLVSRLPDDITEDEMKNDAIKMVEDGRISALVTLLRYGSSPKQECPTDQKNSQGMHLEL